jgi:hypothetical protein
MAFLYSDDRSFASLHISSAFGEATGSLEYYLTKTAFDEYIVSDKPM